MAWVAQAYQCSLCGGIEAVVSWNGQVYRVPVDSTDVGALAVRWPKRTDTPAGGGSMA